MQILNTLFVGLFAFNAAFAEGARVKKIELGADQIAEVKTALGIATIIQAPDIPNSVVVGDSESFKVEYLDQAITIKPLHSGAKSNLYIYTDYRRYNVQLVAVAQSEANYIVYLEPAKTLKNKEKPIRSVEPYLSGIKWWRLINGLKNNELNLVIKRVGLSDNGVALIEFKITSTTPTKIIPDSISLKQNGKIVTIHNLFLSRLDVSPSTPITGTIEILKSELKLNSAIRFEFKGKRTSYLTIQEVLSWEKLKPSL